MQVQAQAQDRCRIAGLLSSCISRRTKEPTLATDVEGGASNGRWNHRCVGSNRNRNESKAQQDDKLTWLTLPLVLVDGRGHQAIT